MDERWDEVTAEDEARLQKVTDAERAKQTIDNYFRNKPSEDDGEVEAFFGKVVTFFAVWIGCMFAFGGWGFVLGWLPALALAQVW